MRRQTDEFSLRYERGNGGPALITVGGELDLASVSPFEEAVERASDEGGSLVIDMLALRFMDSSGLRTLLLARERFSSDDRRLAIAAADPSPVRHLFSIAGVEDRLPLFATRDEAVSFAQGGPA